MCYESEVKIPMILFILMFKGAQVSPSDEDSQTFFVNIASGEIFKLKGKFGCLLQCSS